MGSFQPNARMDTYRIDAAASLDGLCLLIVDGEWITVKCDYSGEIWEYKGRAVGQGHYELRAVGFEGRATLHCFDGSKVFEGFWVEEQRRGMWRIVLS